MINIVAFTIAILSCLATRAQNITSTEQFIDALQKKYRDKMSKTVTFTQETSFYRNDTVAGKQTWYEYSLFPDYFRIDFGDKSKGNFVIYAPDSIFNFKNGRLNSKRAGRNNLILTSGGWIFMNKDEVMQRLKEEEYDTQQFHEDVWNGKKVYVIGAQKGDTSSKQVWVDKENFYAVRIFDKLPDGSSYEGHLSKQIKIGKGWIETHCEFFKQGKLFQVEDYHDIDAKNPIDPKIFDPYAQ